MLVVIRSDGSGIVFSDEPDAAQHSVPQRWTPAGRATANWPNSVGGMLDMPLKRGPADTRPQPFVKLLAQYAPVETREQVLDLTRKGFRRALLKGVTEEYTARYGSISKEGLEAAYREVLEERAGSVGVAMACDPFLIAMQRTHALIGAGEQPPVELCFGGQGQQVRSSRVLQSAC